MHLATTRLPMHQKKPTSFNLIVFYYLNSAYRRLAMRSRVEFLESVLFLLRNKSIKLAFFGVSWFYFFSIQETQRKQNLIIQFFDIAKKLVKTFSIEEIDPEVSKIFNKFWFRCRKSIISTFQFICFTNSATEWATRRPASTGIFFARIQMFWSTFANN